MHRRTFAGVALAAALSGPLAVCAQTPGGARLLFAVSEGTSGGTRPDEVIEKYKPLADAIGRALKAQVIIEPARSFQRLDEGMRAKRFDLALARPSDYPGRAVRDHGYRYVANASPDGQCVFVVPKDSPAKSLADLRGKRLVLPEKVSYMSQFCSAELRDAGFDVSKAQHVKEQEVVVYQLRSNAADLGGIASYSKALKQIEAEGVRELSRSRPQPYMPLVAGPRLTAQQVQQVRAELLKLSGTAEGKEIFSRLSIRGFDDGGEARLRALLDWLEKK